MAIDTEKNSYTVVFAVIMVVVVGAILAGLASGLKPMVKANERYEKQQNILYAMGVNNNQGTSDVEFIPTEIVESEFDKYIKKQYVIQGGEVSENDQAYLIDIKKESTKAKDPNYERRLPLFIGEKDGEEVYIVPVRGKGLWDAIWGFVAMDKGMTVKGVYFDHKGETPGLGANIKERFFMDDFTGEELLDGNEFKGIKVAKGNNDPKNEIKDDYEVDAIAGSTITGDGVTAMLKKDIQMYKSYFETLN
ncbi:Na(+)-translocating NADH-quinone reductase subunit C [Winogradskyella sp. DF17]|uniref:Na(+)-translocating NADH-quinone reductase subunit C n=1 Tax=Winogradskyella pelagia TaxID=2819984 RepID=A0ABS3SZ99_9FLAO|nr:Na(+)-translocating NADH-quinone reductase subunit C [Winogradskyella sp. DF17]MBO3115820.1 Na(+)-translocating NADH-quinone reductase subunit C [Winogradskyella sp. DF17]